MSHDAKKSNEKPYDPFETTYNEDGGVRWTQDRTKPATDIYHQHDITTAEGLLNRLDPKHPDWDHNGHTSPWLFRGVPDARWELTPSAWRTPPTEHFALVRATMRKYEDTLWFRVKQGAAFREVGITFEDLNIEEGSKSRILSHLLGVATELECLFQFAELSNEIGIEVPHEELVSGEDFIYGTHRTSKATPIVMEGAPDFSIPIITSIAQHHGVPTRLLDWSRDPLVASYFALPDGDHQTDGHLAIWALDSRSRNNAIHDGKCNVRLSIESLPRHQSRFIHHQSGVFTALHDADQFYLQTGNWPRTEEVAGTALERFVMPKTEAPKLRRLLLRNRVSRAHLMPTRDNVVKHLAESYRWGVVT